MVFTWLYLKRKIKTMKQFYTLLFFLISTTIFAQAPAGYYDSATGNGYTLKTQLKEIIDANLDGLNDIDGAEILANGFANQVELDIFTTKQENR